MAASTTLVLVFSLMLIALSRSFSVFRVGQSRLRLPSFATRIPSVQSQLQQRNETVSMVAIDNGIDKAQIVTDLDACGERLRQGQLVAFPTETVYGLGCHALDSSAVTKVFQAKERPLTDPLIVHVLEPADAFGLWRDDEAQNSILQTLCQDFWPGPLTLVAVANEKVPPTIMAGTGYCACRSPSHATARALLQAARVPLAAPSANKFGHVSPTTAQHVFDDLHAENVWILKDAASPGQDTTTCRVGVESTVAKLQINAKDDSAELIVLRQGAVSVLDLQQSLKGLDVSVQAQLKRATGDHVANVAPGQTIRHYSPNIPSFLLASSCLDHSDDATGRSVLESAVVIDYGQQLQAFQSDAISYRDLSPEGQSSQAAQAVFDTLRWAEQVPGARYVLFPDFAPPVEDALGLAVKDRLTRAASGVTIQKLQDAMANS